MKSEPAKGDLPAQPGWHMPGLVAASSLTCYSIAWICIVIAILFQFICVLPFWTWVYEDPEKTWQKFRDTAVIKYGLMEDSQIWSGWDSMMLIFTWLPAVIAVIAALLPALIWSRSARTSSWLSSPVSAMCAACKKVTRVSSYPMWPQRFWLWWCNGLDVWHAFLWVGLLILHIIGVWQMTEYYDWEAFHKWDQLGMHYTVPKSVLRLEHISLACAWLLYIDFTFLFFPVAHISFLHTLLGSTWQAIIRYHRWFGHYALLTTTGHALFYYWYWLADIDYNFWDEFFDWNVKSSINYLAGSLAWLCGVALWVTSVNWIRRNYYRVFYVTHIIGFFGFMFFSMLHYYWSYIYYVPGLVVLGLDVILRIFQAQNVSYVSSVQLTPAGNMARLEIPLEASFAKNIKAGQDVFLNIPSISRWSWHPFTIYKVNMGSDTEGIAPSMTLAIKRYGRWSKVLLSKLQHGHSVPVRINGPIGGLHTLSPDVSGVIMFVGGIGASPALALLHEITCSRLVPTTVVFVSRDQSEFTLIDDALLSEAARTDAPWLSFKLFNTSKASGPGNVQDTPGSSSSSPPSVSPTAQHKLNMWDGVKEEQAAPQTTHLNTAAHGLSSFGWNKLRSAQPLLSTWQWLLAFLFANLGAFMGASLAQSATIENIFINFAPSSGWKLGLLYMGCIGVQIIGLPVIMVVFPVYLYRYLKNRKKEVPFTSVAKPASEYIQVLGPNTVGLPEAGQSLAIQRGRPDIASLLHMAVQQCVSGTEVAVILAGPTPMMNEAELQAWEFNKQRQEGQPFLRVTREAYEL